MIVKLTSPFQIGLAAAKQAVSPTIQIVPSASRRGCEAACENAFA